MDLETPVDAWYVWVGVALVSAALVSVTVGLPAQPPPDATKAVNTVDRVASSSYGAEARYVHDATEVRIGVRQVSMRNGGGTRHGSVAFGSVTPVHAVSDPASQRALDRIARGEDVDAVRRDVGGLGEGQLEAAATAARHHVDRAGATWHPTDNTLAVRKLTLDGETVLLVTA